MDIALVLAKHYPDKVWSLVGDEYSNLHWKDDSPKPTLKQLEDLWADVNIQVQREEVEKLRRVAYRETADPLFFEYQRGDATKEDWLSAVSEVKKLYPYPHSANSQE